MVDLKVDNLVARLLLQESARLDENAVASETSSKRVNVREIRAPVRPSCRGLMGSSGGSATVTQQNGKC